MSLKKLKAKEVQPRSKYNRIFSEEFRRTKVVELEQKCITVAEICKLYGVSRTAVYKWIYKYSTTQKRGTKIVVQMESEQQRTQYLLDRTAELERIIGQKQLEIDFLSKVIELAGDEVGFDLKKKYESQHLNGSGNIKPNSATT